MRDLSTHGPLSVPGQGAVNRQIARLAVPALITLAADPLVSLIDTAFVGRLGTASLAALGINAAIFSVAFIGFNFLAYGTTPLVAKAWGQRDAGRVARTITQALGLAVGLGVLAAAVLFFGSKRWLAVLQTPAAAYEEALTYLRIRAMAAPAVLIITAANGAFRGRQDTLTPLKVTVWLNVLNVGGDALLIFGLGWGIAGAATATVIAQWFGALWFLRLLAPDWVGMKAARRDEVMTFLSAGWAILIRTGALLAALTAATASAARIGTPAVAAHQIVMQIWLLLALLVDSLAVAGQAIVGRLLGEGNETLVPTTVRQLTLWGLLVGTFLAGALLLVGALLEPIFGVTPQVAELAKGIIPFVAAVQPLGGVLFVGDGVFLGASRFRFLAGTSLVAGFGSIGVIWLLDGTRTDLLGVWLGIGTLLILRLIPQVVSFARHGTVSALER